MRFLLLAALAFHMTLGPVCMMHTAYATENTQVMLAHEGLMTPSDCPDCMATHEPIDHDAFCAGNCISVKSPDPLTFAPQTVETTVAMMPADIVLDESESTSLLHLANTIHLPLTFLSKSTVLLL